MKDYFNEIYRQYSNEVYRYILLLTHDEQVSEEVTQETFYQAFKSIHSFKGQCSLYTYLCAIAKNCLKKYYEKNKKYRCDENIEEYLAKEEIDYSTIQSLYLAISHLKSPYREVVQLHVFDGFSLKEIAAKYGKSESFAKVTFLRAKKMLREELEK